MEPFAAPALAGRSCCTNGIEVAPEPALIAIVDDDQAFRGSLRRLLKSHGYETAMFASGVEFLKFSKLRATTCLVADINMPFMTGIDLYQRLISMGHSIPTILITGYPEERARQRMLGIGVSCYLSKPLNEADFMECLRSAIVRN